MTTALVTCRCGYSFAVPEESIGYDDDAPEDAMTVSCPQCLRDVDPWEERRRRSASDDAEPIVVRRKDS